MNIIYFLFENSIIFFQTRKNSTGVDNIFTAIYPIMAGVNRFLSPIVCSLKRFHIKNPTVYYESLNITAQKNCSSFTSLFFILFVCAFLCTSHSLFCLVPCKFNHDILPSTRIFASAQKICDATFSSFDGSIASDQPIYLVFINRSSLQDYNS